MFFIDNLSSIINMMLKPRFGGGKFLSHFRTHLPIC